MRSGDCLSAFVYLVKGSNSWVGYVQGINGIMQVRIITDYCHGYRLVDQSPTLGDC